MNTKTSFILYADYLEQIALLPMKERGELFTAILEYAASKKEPETLSAMSSMAFSFIRNQLDRDLEKYEKLCEKNRQNAKARYARSATADDRTPSQAIACLNDNDNDNDNDTVYDNENEGGAVKGGVRRGACGGRKKERKKEKISSGSFDTDEFFEAALRRSYGSEDAT